LNANEDNNFPGIKIRNIYIYTFVLGITPDS